MIDSSKIDTEIKGDIYQEMKYKGHKIEKRKDGRWQARIRQDGKQHFIYAKSQIECLNKLKELYKEKPKLIKPQIKLFEAWEYWYNKYKKPLIREDTLKNIRSVFKNQLSILLENKNLKDINSLDFNLAINKIDKPRMKEYACQYIKDFLKSLYKEKLIKYNISDEIKSFHSVRKEGNSLTIAQRKILVDKSYLIENGEMFRFYLFSGVRPAEIFLIKDTDIEKDFIHIPGTKTEKSDRYIPKFKQLNEVLEKLKGIKGQLFKISETTRKRRIYELRQLCGFHFNVKDLRTTFATMCAENGVQQNVIAKWLGHTNVTTTNKYYIKVLNDYEREQIRNLEHKIDSQIDSQNN